MLLKSENDFNNFRDTIYDKYNKPGYLIQRKQYYIFQPFDENENVPMYYRENVNIENVNRVQLKSFIKQKYGDIKVNTNIEDVVASTKKQVGYDFDSTIDYYDNRDENFIVG